MKLWIRIDAALPRDPGVGELASRLGVRKAEAIGLLLCVWSAVAEHRPTGDVSDISPATIEDWAGFEPHGKAKRGMFASAFSELFTRDGAVRGWKDRQGKLIERMEKDRKRKEPSENLPRKFHGNSTENIENSTEFPRLRNGTERNDTEQEALTTNFIFAKNGLSEKLPAEYRPDMEAFLRALGAESRQLAWVQNLDAKLTGMHPPIATPEVVGASLRQMIANGSPANWKLFEGYLRRTDEPAPARNDKDTRPADPKGRGLLIIGELRAKRTTTVTGHGVRYSITAADVEALDPAAQQALKAIGGPHKVANHDEDKFGILASQFAAMYAAASSKQSTESAA